jgi:hypothetical protein
MLFVRESSNKCHLYLPGNWLIYFAINRPCAGADGFHLTIPQTGFDQVRLVIEADPVNLLNVTYREQDLH